MTENFHRLVTRRLRDNMSDRYKERDWIWHRYEMKVIQPGVTPGGIVDTLEVELIHRKFKVLRATENGVVLGEIPQVGVQAAPDRFLSLLRDDIVYAWPTEQLARSAFIELGTKTSQIWKARKDQIDTTLAILAEYDPEEFEEDVEANA